MTDTKTTETDTSPPVNMLRSVYRDWVAAEGIPVAEGFCIDLRTAPTAPWARYGVDGSVVNVAGRGDYLDMWLLDLPAGGETIPQHHIFDIVAYVISGHGNAMIEGPGGTRAFEFGPKSAFAVPLNARYRFFNASGTERARIAMVTAFPIMMNIFDEERFIFGLDYEFESRYGKPEDFSGEGHTLDHADPRASGIWVTNFVADMGFFDKMSANDLRGKASKTTTFDMADNSLTEHMSEIPVGMYKKAHRHPGGTHIFAVTGRGYSLLWYKGDKGRIRVDWEHGFTYAPPEDMYHQHFNVSGEPARYFAIKWGSMKREFNDRITRYRNAYADATVGNFESAKAQEIQIEYEDEDPAIKELYLSELAKSGIPYRGQ